MERRKIFVLSFVLLFIVGLVMGGYLASGKEGKKVSFSHKKSKELPTFGAGSIELIVFEDFRCHACRIFSESILPRIAQQFIRKGRIRYRFAPIAFSSDSKLLANAALAVCEQAPNRFFSFADALFHIGEISEASILSLAKEIGGIDLAFLKQCLKEKRYDENIDANLAWLRAEMGESFAAPMLLINGAFVSARSFQEIAQVIQEME